MRHEFLPIYRFPTRSGRTLPYRLVGADRKGVISAAWNVPHRMSLSAVHASSALIIAVIAGNAVLAGWAFASDLRRMRALPGAFWTALLLVLALLVLQAAAGIVMTAGGARPKAALHFLYGILVLGTAVVQYGLRPGGFVRASARGDPARFREPRVLALICLTQAALIMRAYMTGVFGR